MHIIFFMKYIWAVCDRSIGPYVTCYRVEACFRIDPGGVGKCTKLGTELCNPSHLKACPHCANN